MGPEGMHVLERERDGERRIAGEDAHFEGPLGRDHAGEERHERALLGADLHRGLFAPDHVLAAARQRGVFRRIGARQVGDEFGREAKRAGHGCKT